MTENQQAATQEEAGLERSSFVEGWVGRISYWIFHRRRVLLIVFVLVTIVLGAMASQLRVQAGFTKMIPLNHEYMQTFLEYQADFGGANRVLVAVKNRGGTIFEKEFMETLRQVTEDVFFINGVERSSVTSLFTPNVRYNEVVEDGFRGGNIVGADFDGSPAQLAQGPREPAQVGLGRAHRRQRPDRRDGGRDAAGERSADRASGSTCRTSRSSSRRSAASTRTRARACTSSASPRRWATSPRAPRVCCCSSASPSSSPRSCSTGIRARWCSR